MTGQSRSVTRQVRADIRAMATYAPGEQVDDCIKLNTNESIHEPAPAVMTAIHDFAAARLRRYPQPLATELCQAAATWLGVAPDMVLAGNGSDDCLTILYRSHLRPGDRLACPWPTYSLYDNLATLQGAEPVHLPWEGLDQDRWELPDGLDHADHRLVLVCNPNNPSGTVVPTGRLAELARRLDGILVVDEAYVDFAAPGSSAISLLAEHRNIVVLRSFSKSYSLAGARLGLLVAAPELVHEYRKVKDSYNVSALTQAIGLAAIGDQAHHHRIVADTLEQRQRLGAALRRLGWSWPPSGANFLLCRVGPRAGGLYRALKARGILVRWWDRPDLREHLRISVGRPDENDALLAALAELH